ncbi:MAG: DUF3422 domain-containing protein [Burkholderiales bacterium]|nr:DUF3422 domain-containing protein [Burkholderiales bacterium]
MRLPPNHPQRYLLSNEIHARPPQELSAPERLSYIAISYEPVLAGLANPATSDLARLCVIWGAPLPTPEVTHFVAEHANLRLKWERHTEFVTFTFSHKGEFERPFENPVIALVNEEWLATLAGKLVVAIHLAVQQNHVFVPDLQEVAAEFDDNYLVGAKVAGGNGIVMTDLKIHADDFGRMLLMDLKLGKRQGGRTVQRLLEIETYRTMALFGLPVAHATAAMLRGAERELAEITSLMAQDSTHDEPALLVRLTRLAATVESEVAANSFRFGASRAYYDLTKRRIAELREERLMGVQTIEEFMDRRLAPAMATCSSAEKRLLDLSERVARASDLLRTRVDIEREQQNQSLLASMNRRAQLQLRLQQTVEGLSIAAITYYVVGLVGYAAKALKEAGVPLSVELVTGASIPFVAGAMWLAVRRLRKHLKVEPESVAAR